jgi:glycerophosphoryl diester phosphodiesterase
VRLRRDSGPPLCIGHRGAPALAPPNTRAGIEAALDAGVDLVELDVLASSGPGLVLAHSLHELPSEPLALDDALALVAAGSAGVLLDVKSAGNERGLVASVRRHGLVDRALASTTNLAILHALRVLEPQLARSVTYPRNRARAAALARVPRALPWRIVTLLSRVGAVAATLNYRIVTPDVVSRCHAFGAAVFAWTVNDASLHARLDGMGVDGLITDNPAICRATLKA